MLQCQKIVRFGVGVSALGLVVGALCLIGTFWGSPALGDTVTLKDGTVLEGTVIKRADSYWVKTPDGETHDIPKADVQSVNKGSGERKPTKGITVGGSKPKVGTKTTKGKSGSPSFSTAASRAKAVDTPLAAVAIWQEFIDSDPDPTDAEEAKKELEKWQKLADEGGEKIKGKWIGGDERKAIHEKANKLYGEALQLEEGGQTLQAVAKLKEAAATYPNSFQVNFLLGYLMMIQHNTEESGKYFKEALRIKPQSPETLANLALLEVDRHQFVKAITMLHKAAQGMDNPAIAMNLVSAVYVAGPKVRKNRQLKEAIEASRLLAAKYGMRGEMNTFTPVPLAPEAEKAPNPGEEVAVGMSSGTGFFINEDGLILTNRHVVDGGKTFMVMMNDGSRSAAEIVVMDDEQDLALVRLKSKEEKKYDFARLAEADTPGDGAECTVMGFPLIDRLGGSIKITRGIVSSSGKSMIGPDVMIDARVNPGNSGGPILDKHGNVMAIVSMKTLASATEDTYGLGISAGQIRKFLTKNKVEVEAGEAGEMGLSAEEIAAKVKPAAVCILATR